MTVDTLMFTDFDCSMLLWFDKLPTISTIKMPNRDSLTFFCIRHSKINAVFGVSNLVGGEVVGCASTNITMEEIDTFIAPLISSHGISNRYSNIRWCVIPPQSRKSKTDGAITRRQTAGRVSKRDADIAAMAVQLHDEIQLS